MRFRIGRLELKIPWEYLVAPLLTLLALVIMIAWRLDYEQTETISVMVTQSSHATEKPAPHPTEDDVFYDVPDIDDVETEGETLAPARVNINTAGMDELISLPYIGEVKAKAIIGYRMTHGPFKTPEDLLNVKGIGPKTLERLRDHIILD